MYINLGVPVVWGELQGVRIGVFKVLTNSGLLQNKQILFSSDYDAKTHVWRFDELLVFLSVALVEVLEQRYTECKPRASTDNGDVIVQISGKKKSSNAGNGSETV